MAEYIERAKITDALIDNTSIVGRDLEEAVNAICAIPAADVRPVQHGVWLKIKYRSICRDCSFRGFASWKYCPNCGRQMTTEGDNG